MNLWEGVAYLFNKLDKVFLSVGSVFSLTSLICALSIAVLFLVIKRRQRNRPVRIKTIARALYPRRIANSPSHAADIGYFFFGIFVFGLILGSAVISYQVLTNALIDLFVTAFGAVPPTSLPEFVSRSAITLTLFLAYELAYWIHHYLSHRVPILWEFHKLHHTATVLTPLTVFRVHPADTVLHANITAIVLAIANSLVSYSFGKTTYQYAVTDSNVMLVLFIHAYIHLQHTHLWIPFGGILGRILMSPAHHQVHHSTNPLHFNKNLGSCLAVWDWLFGTLHVPNKEPEKLTFGIEDAGRHAHTLTGGLIAPVYRASLHIGLMIRRCLLRPGCESGSASEVAVERRTAG